MERVSGQARTHFPSTDRCEPAPAPHIRFQRPVKNDTYGCGECANRLGKSTEWFRDHLEDLYARGMPRPIDQPGHRRWDRLTWEAWRLGFAGPKDAANDAAPREPVTIEDHREILRRAYGTCP